MSMRVHILTAPVHHTRMFPHTFTFYFPFSVKVTKLLLNGINALTVCENQIKRTSHILYQDISCTSIPLHTSHPSIPPAHPHPDPSIPPSLHVLIPLYPHPSIPSPLHTCTPLWSQPFIPLPASVWERQN